MSAYDSQKQKPPQTRPVEVCVGCTKTKPIFTHLRGDPRLPLCNACNMKLRRESPEAQQIKLIKLCGTAMGTVQSILTLPLEGGDQEAIERMRDSLRAMLHRWSAEQQPEQDEAATSVTTKQGETAATAVPASAVNIDELPPEARARVIAKINVPAASSIASKASEEEPPKPRAKQGKHGLKEDKEEQKQVEAVSAIGTSNG